MDNGNVIKKIREDVRFWIFIGGFFAIALIWAIRLEAQVNAMEQRTQEKGTELRKDVEDEILRSKQTDREILEKLGKIEHNQIKIMAEFGIKP